MIGLLIAAGAGSGMETIMSGYPMRAGGGRPITTVAGLLSAVSGGAGFRRPGAMSTGDRGMSAGTVPAAMSAGHLWLPAKSFTGMDITVGIVWTLPLPGSAVIELNTGTGRFVAG